MTVIARMRRSAGVLVMTYGLLVTVGLLASLWIPDTFGPMGLFTTAAHILMALALVGFPLALWAIRPRRAALTLLPAALAFVAVYGVHFIPNRGGELIGAGVPLRVMTFNVLYGQRDFSPEMDVIRAADPDVVAFQELNWSSAAALSEGLADEYPYMVLDPSAENFQDTGFVSRYPIVESRYFDDSFGFQRIVVDVDGTQIAVYNIHHTIPLRLSFPFIDNTTRTSEVTQVLEVIQADSLPVVVMGDFNMSDLNDDYGRYTAHLTDVHRAVGQRMGLTHSGPLVILPFMRTARILRLDYVFVSDPARLRPISLVAWQQSGSSDHLPVVAVIEVMLG